MTADESIAGFEHRRGRLLELACRGAADLDLKGTGYVPGCDFTGIATTAQLYLGREPESANRHLREIAEWFDRPLPDGFPEARKQHGHHGPCTFVAAGLCRAWHLFKNTGKLEAATRQRIRRFFMEFNLESQHPSENHVLLFRTNRYLMAQEWPEETFKAYKQRGGDLAREDAAWLKSFIRYRARRGWGEFDSACYFAVDWNCLTGLYDYASDGELKNLAGMMMDLMLADMAVDSVNGMYCGAHGRIYGPHAMDHAKELTYALQYLYFGTIEDDRMDWPRPVSVEPLVSSYRPERIVLDIALDRTEGYLCRERKHLHNVTDILPVEPLSGSIRKVTRYTPDYILGAIQYQDAYPDGCKGAWYAHHEQHEWDLSFGTRTRARIFTHHPNGTGNEAHGYWTGDLRCGCVSTFQQQNAVLALYNIPRDQPCQYIHAYIPHDALDEVVEQDGWIFMREGRACAALRMLGGHRPTEQERWKDVEIISPGARNGAVCEAGRLDDFAGKGGFEGFKREIAGNRIAFDRERMRLCYTSKRAGTISIDTAGRREANGRPADLDYPAYDCPYLQSEWDSGKITLRHGVRSLQLDFIAGTRSE